MSSAGNIQTDIVTHGLPIIMFMLMLTNTNAEIMMMIIMMMMMMVQQFEFSRNSFFRSILPAVYNCYRSTHIKFNELISYEWQNVTKTDATMAKYFLCNCFASQNMYVTSFVC